MVDSPNPVSPLSATSVAEALTAAGLELPPVTVLDVTDSTNDEALARAASGAAQWSTVVADQQRAGRGRLGRMWQTPPGNALLLSTVLRPPGTWPASAWGWIPLIAGLAATSAASEHCPQIALKWPNDVVIDGPAFDGSAGPRKLAGILAERRGDAVVVGIGINVHHSQSMLPIAAGTSLAIEGADVERSQLLAQLLASWQSLWKDFAEASANPLSSGIRELYKSRCATIGKRVRVEVSGVDVVGEAIDIDSAGHLVIDGAFGRTNISAGDVIHLRSID